MIFLTQLRLKKKNIMERSYVNTIKEKVLIFNDNKEVLEVISLEEYKKNKRRI